MRTGSWFGLGLALLASPVVAEEGGSDRLPIIDMDTVVVTATQTANEAFTTAKIVDKIGQDQLATAQVESVAEAVQDFSNVDISQGPRQISQQVNIRGLTGKEVLQVVDGARQNFQNGHQGAFFIEPELLKEIEVLKGPGSSLWGSGAIGGVVNMTTVDPSDLLAPGATIGAQVKGGYASSNHLFMSSDSVYGRVDDKNQYLLNFTYRDTQDITAGDDIKVPNSAFWDRSGMAKWVSHFAQHQTLRLSYIAFDAFQNVPSDPRQNSNPTDNPLVDQNIFQQNWNATYEYTDPHNDWLNFVSTLYYNDTEVSDQCLGTCSAASGGAQRRDVTDYQTVGITARNSSYIDWLTLTYGAEIYQDSTAGLRNGEQRPQFPDAKADVWATYLQAEIPFWETWSLTPGIRYDHFRNNPRQDVITLLPNPPLPPQTTPLAIVNESDVSSSMALSWQTTRWMSVHAIYDEAFRAPAIDELYPSGYHFAFGPYLNQFMPNPDLQPEKARNKELSARFAWDHLMHATDQLRARVSVFRNDVDNLIQQQIKTVDNLNSYTIYENVANARLTGTEVDTTYRLQNWHTGVAYGYIKGINKNPTPEQTDYLDDIPPERLIFNLGRYFYQDALLTGVRLTHAWGQDRVSQPGNCVPGAQTPANACPIPHYTTTDIYAVWEPTQRKLAGLRVNVALNNITDRHYYNSTSSLLPEEGRNVELSASYTF